MSKEEKRSFLIGGIIVLIVFCIFYFGIKSFVFKTKSNTTNDNETVEDSYESNKATDDDSDDYDYDIDYFNKDKDNQKEDDLGKETNEELNQKSNEVVVNKGTGYKKNTGYNKGGNSGGGTTPTITTVTSNIGGQVMSCNATSGNKCNITLPGYIPKDGYEFIGWNTNKNAHTGAMSGQSYGVSNGETLYPITRKEGVTYTVTFDGSGSGISSVGSSKLSCTIKEVYNDEVQPTSCDIILPNIKVNEGYSASGWSTNPSDTNVLEGGSKVSIDKDTTFYANALGNSYTIEYYNGDNKLGSSNALVGVDTTLTSSTMLGVENVGYTFKGWDITSPSNNVVYSDSEVVNSLTLTDGDTIRLYAVYIDDIKPVCSFGTSNTLSTGDTTTLKLTCTDTGSGMDSQNLTSTNFTVSNGNGQITGVSTPTKVENGYSWDISVKGVSTGSFNVSLKENSIRDKSNNTNLSITSNDFTVNGKTYTATFTKGGNVTNIGATTLSCTTTGSNTSCIIIAPTITPATNYEVVGWNTNMGATTGTAPNSNITLTGNATYHTIVKSKENSNIIAAYDYTYNEYSNKTGCITGEESSCVANTCYKNKSSGSCVAGTIIKYKVNDSETKYFHVLYDDGATITMQQRENIVDVYSAWNDGEDATGYNGPITALTLLENATSGWSNVNTQIYTMGTTLFNNNRWTGCDRTNRCTLNIYTLPQRSAKARMLTMQEREKVCGTYCDPWMYNFLAGSIKEGGTVNSGKTSGYWMMNSNTGSMTYTAWYEDYESATFTRINGQYASVGIRAVVVINK